MRNLCLPVDIFDHRGVARGILDAERQPRGIAINANDHRLDLRKQGEGFRDRGGVVQEVLQHQVHINSGARHIAVAVFGDIESQGMRRKAHLVHAIHHVSIVVGHHDTAVERGPLGRVLGDDNFGPVHRAGLGQAARQDQQLGIRRRPRIRLGLKPVRVSAYDLRDGVVVPKDPRASVPSRARHYQRGANAKRQKSAEASGRNTRMRRHGWVDILPASAARTTNKCPRLPQGAVTVKTTKFPSPCNPRLVGAAYTVSGVTGPFGAVVVGEPAGRRSRPHQSNEADAQIPDAHRWFRR